MSKSDAIECGSKVAVVIGCTSGNIALAAARRPAAQAAAGRGGNTSRPLSMGNL